ncbi:bifunctional folylpolyglutamate synthase/dihydrofolate synthase [Pontibacillus salicampi]|uniref:tetrahydrofolate synthase n=1 Tax=Pontibacillus salicampi TaxID=1449801 RepID=A0ABV6LJ98_9BACI
MDFQEALDWIHSRHKFGIRPGLDRMHWLMDKLGNPEQQFKAIHVAGTNGKGSTISFLRHILGEAGWRVGTFTSPHVIHFNERISINGVFLENKEWVSLVERIKPIVEELEKTELGPPTEFEVVTAMAYDYFGYAELDYALVETGLGGKLDSTNIITPELSIITSIGKDHMHILGDSVEAITWEKAGIIKEERPVLSGVTQSEAQAILKEAAMDKNAPFQQLDYDFFVKHDDTTPFGEIFSYQSKDKEWGELSIQMKGYHQVRNAALAVEGVIQVVPDIKKEHVISGLEKTSWVGRFEQVSTLPTIIIDGAHNEEGIQAMVKTVQSHFPTQRKYVLFAALSDKPLANMVAHFDDVFYEVTFTSFNFPRAISAKELSALSDHPNKRELESWQKALNNYVEVLEADDVLIISGSLYFISEVRKFFE